MLSAGQLIWTACRPLIRLTLVTIFGFGLAKADVFPQVAARGAGQIILNVALPCLMFSKIVPAFTSDNIGALGPLCLVAVLYELVGVIIAWVVKQFFWVPHRFRYGILVAGGWGNWGDIPTSAIMSICGSAPFGGLADQNLAVAYVSVFILIFFITLFPIGGHRLVAWDYVGPDIEDDEAQEQAAARRRAFVTGAIIKQLDPRLLRRRFRSATTATDVEARQDVEEKTTTEVSAYKAEPETYTPSPLLPLAAAPTLAQKGRHVSFGPQTPGLESQVATAVNTEAPHSRFASPAPTETHVDSRAPSPAPRGPAPQRDATSRRTVLVRTSAFLRSLLTPASISIVAAIVIALVPSLKALFVPDTGVHVHPAPDGQPPLAVLLDTASFVGNASVPIGLICLGAALARLKLPSFRDGEAWARMPLGAIGTLAVGKVVLMPVLGILICEGLTSAGVIDREDKVLRFVCMFFSCLPTATTQVFLTQVYSGTGDADHLSAFLIPQYILMFISMTATSAYSIQLLF